ncbi:MAG: hypothetical protein DRP84_10720 [Spirochaetes bacterium]|nr:MAG: hypothetical protein DRP84_10720 [Spirochaetota bacterium]
MAENQESKKTKGEENQKAKETKGTENQKASEEKNIKEIIDEIKKDVKELIEKGKKIDIKQVEEKVEKSMSKFFEKTEYTTEELKNIMGKIIDASYKTLGDSIENSAEIVSTISSATLKAITKTKKYSEKTINQIMDFSLTFAKDMGIKMVKAPFMAFEGFMKGILGKK